MFSRSRRARASARPAFLARLGVAVVLGLATCAALPAVAHAADAPATQDAKAQKKRAAARFGEAEALFRKHQYDAAADAFEEAFTIAPHPVALLNSIDARVRAGQLARAANACLRFLREVPESDKSAPEARRQLADLRPKLGLLKVRGKARDLRVDGRSFEGDEVYVDPGDHKLEGVLEGASVRRKVQVVAGATESVLLEPEPVAAPVEAAPKEEPKVEKGKGLPPMVAYVGIGLTVALAGVTTWSGLDTNAARRAFDDAPTPAGLDDGRAKQSRTNVLLVATGIVAVGTGVVAIFATDWKGDRATNAAVFVGPGNVGVRGSF